MLEYVLFMIDQNTKRHLHVELSLADGA